MSADDGIIETKGQVIGNQNREKGAKIAAEECGSMRERTRVDWKGREATDCPCLAPRRSISASGSVEGR